MIVRPTSRLFVAAFLLACASSCSSGKASVDGGVPAGYTRIDDMEGGGQAIEWTPPSGAPGWWYTATDCSANGDISPPPATVVDGAFVPGVWSYSALPTAHETFPGVMSTHAARLRTTSPLQGVWGASMGFAFSWSSADAGGRIVATAGPDAGAQGLDASAGPATCPIIVGAEAAVDLSAYSGVTFWAKGDPTGERTLQVRLQDLHTDPAGGLCSYIDSNSPDFCYNGFGAGIALTETFAQYTIDFTSLQQDPNWGYRPDPDVFDAQHVYQLIFQVSTPTCFTNEKCVGGAAPPVSFDIWIDDLYFVNK